MTRWVLSFLLQGIVLPLSFLSGATLRQNGQSIIYLFLLFLNPTVPIPTVKTMLGWTGFYQKFVLCLTIINMLASFAFQIVLISNPPYGHLVEPPCSMIERYLRYAGLIRFDALDIWTITRTIVPEIIILVTTLIVHAACKSLNPFLFEDLLVPISEPPPEPESNSKIRSLSRLITLGKYLCLMTLCVAGIIRPSVLNGVYFISFLIIMTLWGFNKPLGKGFAYFCRLLLVCIASHVIALFLYQMQWAQELLPSDSGIPRYLGLIALIKTNCSEPRLSELVNLDWDFFVNPFILIVLYYVLYFESSLIINTPDPTRRSEDLSSPVALTEATPLIRGKDSFSRKHGRKGVVDNRGNVTITELPEPTDDKSDEGRKGAAESIELKPIKHHKTQIKKENTGFFEVILNVSLSAIQLVTKSSYLAANISMMAWSITYHSWLTFVLLLWASLLWLVPNQRKVMLRCSPFLVLYALCLLVAQYIYGMDLTDEELPQTISGLNLKQIGFEKIAHFPILPLTIKSLFTLMFWITLKQHNQEKWEARNRSTLADIAAPFQIGLGPAAVPPSGASKTSAFVENFGIICRGILVKFWIWVVASILFTIGIAGERITLIRIVYMSMALLFILTFQFNWSMWRNMMYSFWLVLIIYSMIVLVVTYTYQFDNFDRYWEEYLKIPLQLQKDIGLERFETKELFVKLLTPTVFVIITVVQVHYFHNEFLAISDIKSRGTSVARKPSTAIDISSENGELKRANFKENFLRKCSVVANFIWLFLELHLLKLVMLSIMLLAANDVCAIHFTLVSLVVIGVLLKTSMQIMISHICSLVMSALIILKMVYQINYINHQQWDVDCPEDNVTRNTAEWIGFRKTSSNESLPYLVKGYIGVLIVITFHAVVLRRQKFQRHMQGRQLYRPFVMFPRITHNDVDKDIPHCLMYLLNYGFYRFGVEISLISIVALIGIRMDFYAALYALFLCFLGTPNRKRLTKLWPFFTMFIVITIPLQYSLSVGAPPMLCIVFPWDQSELLQKLRNWMFFPDTNHPPKAYKLICDFFVLMFVSRQALVFNIEKRNRNEEYAGGSNKPVLKDFERKGFVNPVPDFFSVTRSFLDVVKRTVFAASFWICLALVFLAGTNRVNLFSLGYLIGAFIFLWQGNDLYLRPIKTILVWWNFLFAYNIGVIFSKAILQIVGCVFIDSVETYACWLVQLLGIACIEKFEKSDVTPSPDVNECLVPRSEVGLAWDGLCFALLILQRRLFSSHYFMRMIDEAKAMAILASRGAELIEDLSNKQVEFQRESERQLLEKIKSKMDRIKASQKKLHGPNYQDPESHSKAVLSGDYFMFDDDEEDVDLISEMSVGSFTTTLSDENVDLRRTSVAELISSAMKTGVKTAINEAAATNLRSREESDTPLSDDGKPSTSGTQKKKKGRWKTKSFDSTSLSKDGAAKKSQGDTLEVAISDETRIIVPSGDGAGDDKKDGDDKSGSSKEGGPISWLKKCLKTCLNILLYVQTVLTSIMVSITRFLNRTSRDYRYIMKTLSIEKKMLLMTQNFGNGMRAGPENIWRPGPYLAGVPKDIKETKFPDYDEITPDDSFSQHNVTVSQFEEEGELKAKDQSPFIRMILAIWFALLSHSELTCYIVIFLHQIFQPTVLSLPLPLMVFCWGTLTVPRPSKTFWVTIIAYTEIVVVTKCIFQFEFFLWNKKAIADNAPFEPARIIGIEKKPLYYAYFDLGVLLMVFFHRTMLKQLGLWRSTDPLRTPPVIEVAESDVNIEIKNETETKSNKTRDSSSSSSSSASSSSSRSGSKQKKKSNKTEETMTVDTVSLLSKTKTKKKNFKEPIINFFKRLVAAKGRVTVDVYAYMFFFDFINFLIVIFGFSAFGTSQGDGGVSEYFAENKVPVAFLVMLILQFGLIIIDRTLYLRKFILGKLIYQYILIFGIHIWMFFILPAVTHTSFNSSTPPMLWYMCKCFYLLLSAYQIRCGYPTRIFGNFLCKSFNYINMILFKVFMAVPFVFELRTLMDWIWTDTSMTLSDWLKMEDIFSHVFQLKCQRRAESAYPQPRGEKKKSSSKYLVGGGCLIAIIAVIWFPLVLFALGNTVGKPNLPAEMTMSLRVGPYAPIYEITAQNNSIFTFTESQWEGFSGLYWQSRTAQTFLSNYIFDDVGVVIFNTHSTVTWSISPPDKTTMLLDLESDETIIVRLDWKISRTSANAEEPKELFSSVETTLGKDDPAREAIAKYLRGEPTTYAPIPNIFPKFLKVTNRGTTDKVKALVNFEDEGNKFVDANPLRPLKAMMDQKNGSVWWQVGEYFGDPLLSRFFERMPYYNDDKLILYTFNDKAFPATLTIVSGKGIIGLYTTFVIVVHSLIRGFFTGVSFKIMFDDMPNVDRILQLCLDIYLVRESGELDLEEDLFAKLVFLYRSPETLIKWTRPPEEAGEDDGEIPPAALNE